MIKGGELRKDIYFGGETHYMSGKKYGDREQWKKK
jgi:hypothetical protein